VPPDADAIGVDERIFLGKLFDPGDLVLKRVVDHVAVTRIVKSL